MKSKKIGCGMVLLLSVLALSLYGCGDDGGGGGGGGGGHAEGEETHLISVTGGEGTVGAGGNGGFFGVYAKDGTPIRILKEGEADTSFDLPEISSLISPLLDFGSKPWEVTTSTTVDVFNGAEPADGVYHLHSGDHTLWARESGLDVAVTGLKVQEGVTLTLGLNFDENDDDGDGLDTTGQDTAEIAFPDDVRNEGTIQVKDLTTADGTPDSSSPLDMGSLDFLIDGVLVNEGHIFTAGGDSAIGAGGNGGALFLDALTIVNTGEVDASGGDGTSGGHGNWAAIQADDDLWNTGPIFFQGGKGSSGPGGHGGIGGAATLGFEGALYNSATLNASGGDGATAGGDGGGASLGTGGDNITKLAGGNLLNSGHLLSNGGSATAAGNGGNAGLIQLIAKGANLRSSGALEAQGGQGQGAGSTGGAGGIIGLTTDTAQDPMANPVPAGSIQVGGDLRADGGSGETGGPGFQVAILQKNSPATGTIELLGYRRVDLRGGKGQTDGGNGATLAVIESDQGKMYNEVPFQASGGQGVTGTGGNAGTGGTASKANNMENRGDMDFSGGPGQTQGGNGGGIILNAPTGSIQNAGNLKAEGGDASDPAAGVGGKGGVMLSSAQATLDNGGRLDFDGGQGPLTGGAGGVVSLVSVAGNTNNSGSAYANGGRADPSLGGSVGGGGGNINLQSAAPAVTDNTAETLQVVGGVGAAPGVNGHIVIDSVDVTPPDGTLP
jgi:hypothetical protein